MTIIPIMVISKMSNTFQMLCKHNAIICKLNDFICLDEFGKSNILLLEL